MHVCMQQAVVFLFELQIKSYSVSKDQRCIVEFAKRVERCRLQSRWPRTQICLQVRNQWWPESCTPRGELFDGRFCCGEVRVGKEWAEASTSYEVNFVDLAGVPCHR